MIAMNHTLQADLQHIYIVPFVSKCMQILVTWCSDSDVDFDDGLIMMTNMILYGKYKGFTNGHIPILHNRMVISKK